jgi:hypothetical protein
MYCLMAHHEALPIQQAKADPESVIRQFESGATPSSDASVAEYVKARGTWPRAVLRHVVGATRSNASFRTRRRWFTPTGWTRTR